ncbi:hypothetical protein Ddc_09744 [Ditylenchus destructor]|nr:hypothetical protein Ddc_09744 [Ditylenchus destructor]
MFFLFSIGSVWGFMGSGDREGAASASKWTGPVRPGPLGPSPVYTLSGLLEEPIEWGAKGLWGPVLENYMSRGTPLCGLGALAHASHCKSGAGVFEKMGAVESDWGPHKTTSLPSLPG